MPSRNVYVSETDIALFERAAQLAGGLSPAVAAALRMYVAQKEETMNNHDLDLVELDVSDGAVTTRKRFKGSKMLSFNQSHGLRTVTWSIYRTQRHQYAVYTLDAPDWSSMAAAGDSAWEDPRTWSDTFYKTKDKTLRVFATLDEMLRDLPDDVGTALSRMLTDSEPSELDI